MGRSQIIADLRRHRGDARNIIGLIGGFASSNGADVEWLVRPDQSHLSPPGQLIGCAGQWDPNWAGRIRELWVIKTRSDQEAPT